MATFAVTWQRAKTVITGDQDRPQLPEMVRCYIAEAFTVVAFTLVINRMSQDLFIGINETGVHFLHQSQRGWTETKALLSSWTYTELTNWRCSDHVFGIVLTRDAGQIKLVFTTREVHACSELSRSITEQVCCRVTTSLS